MRAYLKNKQCKEGWWSGSSGEHLPSKHEALSSTPSMVPKKKKKIYAASQRKTKMEEEEEKEKKEEEEEKAGV